MVKKITIQPGGMGIKFKGSSITTVVPNSQAENKGVCVGWTILKINGKKQLDDGDTINQALRTAGETGKPMTITFQEQVKEKIKTTLSSKTEPQIDFVRGQPKKNPSQRSQ